MNKYKLTAVFISKDSSHPTWPYKNHLHHEYYKTLKEAKSRFESFKSCKDAMLFINRESDGKCLKSGMSDNVITSGKFSFELPKRFF